MKLLAGDIDISKIDAVFEAIQTVFEIHGVKPEDRLFMMRAIFVGQLSRYVVSSVISHNKTCDDEDCMYLRIVERLVEDFLGELRVEAHMNLCVNMHVNNAGSWADLMEDEGIREKLEGAIQQIKQQMSEGKKHGAVVVTNDDIPINKKTH